MYLKQYVCNVWKPVRNSGLLAIGVCAFVQVAAAAPYAHEKERIGTVRELYDGTLTPDLLVNTLRNIDRIFPTRTVKASGRPRLFKKQDKQITQVTYQHNGEAYDLYDYLALNRVSGMLILKDGKIAYETYQYGNTEGTRWTSMSIAKSITSTLIGAAVKDGYIKSIDDPVTKYVPRLKGSAYEGVSIRNVLMMSSGVQWNETYTDPKSDRRHFLEAQIAQKAGGVMNVMAALPRDSEPGSKNNYSTGETQVLGEILHGAVKKPIAEYLSEKIWKPYGMQADAKWWIDSPGGVEVSGTGLAATLRDFGRFGQFFLDNGVIDGKPVLPEGWAQEASSPKTLKGGEKLDYGYMWWIGETEQSRADKAYFAVGIFGQYLYIDPRERVIIVTTSAEPKPVDKEVIAPEAFFNAVVSQLKEKQQ
ncbi:MAG: Beta-lactamase [Candidatus Tokpelaia hoelldobleri]|uniref:Beta-lactamase n=1 Tax=Candidatus Tokpelaia hoelldobleri TaxID=1902579 RepID=A0A1U9JU34_9HYPH|nr:MAG: Beta-lactamase [Candidatus Tokpelaia hoelldoblerii]